MGDEKQPFRIGLCMAGAISAGAYTAGVVDYLLEALETWQQRKDSNVPNTPMHRVEIPVIGGSSAGGMTGLLTASAIQRTLVPVQQVVGSLMDARPENLLYHSWVDLVADDMLPVLLDTSDIHRGQVPSLLNAGFIDQIAQRALGTASGPVKNRAYISAKLKLFVTLSNLEGMPYSITFQSNAPSKNRYLISSHNDYACFQLANTASNYGDDGWIPLNFRNGLHTDLAQQAAMGTGGFPIGLKARTFSREAAYVNDNPWFAYITKEAQQPITRDPYTTVNVDGGMINNEPFERVRELLLCETGGTQKEMQHHASCKSTVLLIDPFPSEQGTFNDGVTIPGIIGRTLGAVLGQARIKPSDLVEAMDNHNHGQFLIAPVRYDKTSGVEKPIEGSKAIACGGLEGFAGFISKEFRIHDYFLGRANCEKFLRDHFTVPKDTTNQIFREGYAGVEDLTAFISKSGQLQIIPLFTEAQPEAYMPIFANGQIWPTVDRQAFLAHKSLMKKRVEKVLLNLTDYTRSQRLLVWLAGKLGVNGKVVDEIVKLVISDW
jgi:hypothetical protein